jgi:hypothetical protein
MLPIVATVARGIARRPSTAIARIAREQLGSPSAMILALEGAESQDDR